MLRLKTSGALVAGGLVLIPASGCGTDAVGVNTCRDIEYARCEAAPKCPDLFDVPDVDECKRFYRDQCLHGLAARTEPGSPKVRKCVEALQQAGRCAGRDESLSECGSLQDKSTDAKDTCDVIQSPEKLDACAFLVPAPEDESDSDDDDNDNDNDNDVEGSGGAAGAVGSD